MTHHLHESWKADSWGRWDDPAADAERHYAKQDAARDAVEAERASLETAFRLACATFRTSESQAVFAPHDSHFLTAQDNKPTLADLFYDWMACKETPLWDVVDVLILAARGETRMAQAKAQKAIKEAAAWYAETDAER